MSRNAPSFPQTQNTPNSVSVTTATGFNQGDLVYYNNGDYKSPTNITGPSSVNFPTNQPQITFSGGAGGVLSPVFSQSDMLTTDGFGSSMCQSMAVLTNGNIVQVYRSFNNYYPMFRIVNSSGTIVVASTAISTSATYANSSSAVIAVCALTGGGFAVSFVNSANNPAIAVYTNSGSVTTAVFTDAFPSGLINNYTSIHMVGLANGGFVVTGNNSASPSNTYIKIYTSTGATTTNWFLSWVANNSYGGTPIAARSDSSFCIIGFNNTLGTAYAVYNATGTAIVSPVAISGASNSNYVDVACLADGTTFVLVYWDGSSALYGRLLPTGNTLGSAFKVLDYANTYNNAVAAALYFVRILSLSSGGFAVLTTDRSGALYCVFSNSSGTTFYPATNGNGPVPTTIASHFIFAAYASSVVSRGTAYELGGNLYFAYQNDYSYNLNYNIMSFNLTTYAPNQNSYSTLISSTNYNATVSAAPGLGTPSGTTPTKISYFPASSSALPVSQAPSTILSPQTISSVASTGMSSVTLTDGRFAIAWVTNSPRTVYVNVYSSAGALLTTINAGTAINGTFYQQAVKLFSLASGKLGVAFATTTASTISVTIYSSTYSVLYSNSALTPTNFPSLTSDITTTWAVAGCAVNDRFAIVYAPNATTNAYMSIYDNTISLVQYQAFAPGSAKYCITACFNQAGMLFTSWYNSTGSTSSIYAFYQSAASTYTNYATASSGGAYYLPATAKIICTGNAIIFQGASSATGLSSTIGNYYSNAFTSSASLALTTTSSIANNVAGNIGIGTTGYATPTWAVLRTTGSTGVLDIYGGPSYYGGNAIGYYSTPASCLYTINPISLHSSPNINVTAGPGYSSVISYLDANLYPNFIIVNTCPLYYGSSVVAGSTVSVGVPVYPYTSSVTTSVQNTVLSGVANSTSSAGNSASITVNGSATLNSNYPSTTSQSFDYQLPNGTGIQGVKGTISGRNVTLFGNN